MKKKFLLLIAFCFMVLFAYSISDTSKIAKPIIAIEPDGLSEAKAYKLLYENQVKSNDSILNTIFYALGGLGTAVVLVFGSTWWFNDKKVRDVLNEIDGKVESIKKDILSELTGKISNFSSEKTAEINQLQIKLQEEVTSVIAESTKKYNDFTEKTRTEIKEDNRLLVNNYQELLKSYSENITQQLTSLKESYEEKIKLITNQINENEQKYKESLLKESSGIQSQIMYHNAEIAFFKGNFNIALKAYLDYLLFEFKIGKGWSFKFKHYDVIKCLEKVDYIFDDEFEALNSVVELSKEKFPVESELVKKSYSDKKVQKLLS